MSKTSNAVKDRWNKNNYEEVKIRIPKGRKADVEAHAKGKGESINGLVNGLLRADMGLSEDEWKQKPEESDEE